jgi:hypothetical protein
MNLKVGLEKADAKWNSDSHILRNFALLVAVQKNWVTHFGMELAKTSSVLL